MARILKIETMDNIQTAGEPVVAINSKDTEQLRALRLKGRDLARLSRRQAGPETNFQSPLTLPKGLLPQDRYRFE